MSRLPIPAWCYTGVVVIIPDGHTHTVRDVWYDSEWLASCADSTGNIRTFPVSTLTVTSE